MFIENKYKKWYDAIIKTALHDTRTKSKEEYFENHHIIPESLLAYNKHPSQGNWIHRRLEKYPTKFYYEVKP